ncbi:M20/M25/M40 family metallo-hydrolase [Thalassomonas actiniarum]|uniref:M20/M25/M40 family metallo-hydrolase n=1 Tax=Thalassomonas actiniarum TaxID=485447 RepID=A0AAE9YLI7_9GAMM|nr:M20/M25/M40 family metallo-hydrolase [Thalassomonas actiniarum]WDD97470.1 M20/M25/M40 family metallo-hydrolase [Thalassomonas actiniarum]
MKHLLISLVLILSGTSAVVAAKSLSLSATETQIVKQVKQDLPQALAELEQVVNINSGTMNFPGVEKVGRVFLQQLSELGFQSQWLDGKAFNRAGHLVASYGQRGPKILMIGHLDTVFAKEDDFQRFQKLSDSEIAGPGITDMKGGDVIIVSALRALKKLGLLDNVRIRVVMTGDEESSGRPLSLSKKVLIDAAKWADIALGFEDGDSNIKTAVTTRRGAGGWTLAVSGQPAHSSQIFTEEVGDGAIYEAARILEAFRQQLAGLENLTFNPGLIIGGTRIEDLAEKSQARAFGKSNVVAQTVKVKGDIRAVSSRQLEQAKKIMQAIVSDNLHKTDAKLHFAEGYPPMADSHGNRKLLNMYSKISEQLGYGPVVAVNPRKAGAADISFVADHVSMALDGLGLMGRGGHTKDEVADITSFGKNIEKAALLIYRLGQMELQQ